MTESWNDILNHYNKLDKRTAGGLPKVKIFYIRSKHIDVAFSSDEQTKFHDKKVIVLY